MYRLISCLFIFYFAGPSVAEEVDRRLPGEMEAVGGHALALGNMGTAALGGYSSIRVNPGMLPMERQYSLNAGYHWPDQGREFYQMGIVDTVTAETAAGLAYTGFQKDYDQDLLAREELDSPVEQRLVVAIAHPFHKVSVGLSGQFLDAYEERGRETKAVKGTTIGLGLAGLLTPALRFGVSAENLNNRKVETYAPTTYRGGVAWLMAGGLASAHLDYRERQRVDVIEGDLPVIGETTEQEAKGFEDPERMFFASFSAKAYNVLRILGAYGHAVSDDKRRSLSGGLGLGHQGFSLTYNLSRPYMKYSAIHSSVDFSVYVTM